MKANSKHKLTRRTGGALLGASALLALAGCGGGNSNSGGGFNNDTANANLPSVNLVGLTGNNRLISFNSRTPGTSTGVAITGLTAGDTLRAIDFRFPAASAATTANPNGTIAGNGVTGLYAIGQNGASLQLYALTTGGAATPVGARFNLIPAAPIAGAFGFDFNPTVDRIRVFEAAGNRNFRLNPNDGSFVDGDPATPGVQGDGILRYDPSDVNNGDDPDAVGAAYLNPDANPATGTTLYVLDAKNNTLAIQGRADDPATVGTDETVGPNLGRLFTVANLSFDLGTNTGFDISPTNNAAFVSNGNQIFSINIAPGANRGAVTGGASVRGLGTGSLIGIAAIS